MNYMNIVYVTQWNDAYNHGSIGLVDLTGKTTTVRRTAVRETGVYRLFPETPRTSQSTIVSRGLIEVPLLVPHYAEIHQSPRQSMYIFSRLGVFVRTWMLLQPYRSRETPENFVPKPATSNYSHCTPGKMTHLQCIKWQIYSHLSVGYLTRIEITR